jgi:hypothetical protein
VDFFKVLKNIIKISKTIKAMFLIITLYLLFQLKVIRIIRTVVNGGTVVK